MLRLIGCSSLGLLASAKFINSEDLKTGTRVPNLPEYTWDEIGKHKDPQESVWVAFNEGVYDVTNFVKYHPGGNKILLGAGGAIDPYWNLYRVHHKQNVLQMLESMRIGNLKKGQKTLDLDDPYKDDPPRNPELVLYGDKPFNAETPSDLLVQDITTPTSLFFIRNHLPVPQIKAEDYRLEVVLDDDKCLDLSLEDLKTKFEVITVKSCIQCAGNRRADMGKAGHVRGVSWNVGAIGSAE